MLIFVLQQSTWTVTQQAGTDLMDFHTGVRMRLYLFLGKREGKEKKSLCSDPYSRLNN